MQEWALPEAILQTYSPPNLNFVNTTKKCLHAEQRSPWGLFVVWLFCGFCVWLFLDKYIYSYLLTKTFYSYFDFVDAKTPVFIGKKWTKVFLVKTKLTCSLCHPLAVAVYNRNLFLLQYLLGPGLHWKSFHLFQRHEQNPLNLQRRNKLEHREGYHFRSPSHICAYPNILWSSVNLNKNTAKPVTTCS